MNASPTASAGRRFRLDVNRADAVVARVGANYSRFVGAMKLILPLVAAVLVGVVVAWPGLYERGDGYRILLAGLRSGDDDAPGLQRVRYVGSDGADRPYTVTAEAAQQDDADSERFRLRQLQADMTLESGAWVTVMADTGTYQRDRQTLALSGRVDVFSDQGYELNTASALVDLAEGTIVGPSPVRGQGPFGTIEAQSFRARDKGTHLLFEGGVRLVMRPGG